MMNLELKNNQFQGHGNRIGTDNVTIGRVDGSVNFNLRPKFDRNALADWVSDLDFSQNQSQAFERYTNGTLLWALEAPEVRGLLESEAGSILWCSGKPGAGKTVFVSFIVDYLQKLCDKNPKTVAAVCYIYHRYDTTRTALQLFESILKQLILRCPSADVDRVQAVKEQGRRLTLNDIISLLQDIFQSVPNIFIVIDAFDECFSEQTRHQVLLHLQQLRFVKIIITSRPLLSIESAMHGIVRLIISAKDNDIRVHFHAQAILSPALGRLIPKDSEADVKGKVIEKAGGVFLLAHLHIANLAAQTNTTRLFNALKKLPREATATYDQTLERIRQQDEDRQRLAFFALSWIFYALRPLELTELRHAIAISTLESMPEDSDLDDGELIVSCCAGLVATSGYSWDKTVGFIHYTVQEYLNEVRTGPNFLSEFEVTKSSMNIISFSAEKAISATYSLLHYAASAWGLLVHRHEHDDKVMELALSQLANPATVAILRDTWIDYELRSHTGEYTGQCGATAMHLIAVYGLVRTGAVFIETQPESARTLVNERDRAGYTPLIYSIINDHSEVTKMLLVTHFIDLNLTDKRWGRSPLLWAAGKENMEIIRLLLAHPNVNVNAIGVDRQSFIWWAVEKQQLDVLNILLLHPDVDVNIRSRNSNQTLLLWAAKSGNPELARLLLSNPKIDVNATDKNSRTPLWWAAKNLNFEIVDMLLRHPNVNVNIRDKESGQTPLLSAVEDGQLEVVKMLLIASSIDLNVHDKAGRSPLWLAVEKKSFPLTQVLLTDPKMNIDPLTGQTLLLRAAESGQLELVKLILTTQRVDVNAANSKGRTPLSQAAANGHAETVNLLLDTPDVDINASDKKGMTPLWLAAKNRRLNVVNVLLTSPKLNANITTRKHSNKTLFLWAAMSGYTELLALLLASPNVNIKTTDRISALEWAVVRESLPVVELLFDTSTANPNALDKLGRTPLSFATRIGSLDIVQLFLQYQKTDVNATDKNGRTPLWWAVSRGHLGVATRLLVHPDLDLASANVSWDETFFRALLLWAARALSWDTEARHQEILTFLLDIRNINFDARRDTFHGVPLCWAAYYGHADVAKVLLSHPTIDVNERDKTRNLTPLQWASKHWHLEVVEIILSAPNVDVNIRDSYGRTPLSWVARDGKLDVAKLLLAVPQVDLNAPDEAGHTPLIRATRYAHSEMVRLLLNTPNLDTNARDWKYGLTSLGWAAGLGHLDVIKVHLEAHGVDVNSRDEQGVTPLGSAAVRGQLEAVKLLVDNPRVDVNVRDENGFTPILLAAQFGHLPVVNFLFEVERIDLGRARTASAQLQTSLLKMILRAFHLQL